MENSEYLQLRIAKHNMITTNTSNDLTCMNMSGVEMLTDALFYILKNSKVTFHVMKKMILTGCYHLSDLGLTWIADMCPQLLNLELEGCIKVTEKGLTPIISLCKNLHNLTIVGTNVGRIPLKSVSFCCAKRKSTVTGGLRTHGSPIISAGFSILSRKREKEVWDMKKKTSSKNQASGTPFKVMDVDLFKLVVLRDASVLDRLTDVVKHGVGGCQSLPPPISVVNNWTPKSAGEGDGMPHKFTVFEVPAQSALQYAVVSAGSIVVLTYQSREGEERALGDRLAATVAQALAKRRVWLASPTRV
ncbi:uncharacterized protein LOC143297055 [Babylonia areolata]|uniref:uncharacterized protein LOC143297055 n=1 Tax=Babylonia areolata TaxID=304850 RepID=UPI003FD657E3